MKRSIGIDILVLGAALIAATASAPSMYYVAIAVMLYWIGVTVVLKD